LKHPVLKVEAAAFHPDGRLCATGCGDGRVRLWETGTGKSRGRFLAHPQGVRAVAFSPDGGLLLTGCYDHQARLWETATCQPLGPALPHPDRVFAVAFSPDGRTIVTGCRDGTARVWQRFPPLVGLAERITLWIQVLTAMELDPQDETRPLDAVSWQQRLQHLQALGGPPLPEPSVP
jgi:WD40 repeat protein